VVLLCATAAALFFNELGFAAGIAERFGQDRHGAVHVGMYQGESKEAEPRSIKWLGTAFLVDQQCTFVTAKHVLAGANLKEIVVRFQFPNDLSLVRTLPARVLFQSPNEDIAVLKIDQFNGKPCGSGTLHAFQLFSGDLKTLPGEAVFIIGYPVIGETDVDLPVVRTGIVSSAEVTWASGPMLLLDLLGVPGYSGSPVVLADTNEVIGIVFGPGPTQRAFGFEWATPLTAAKYADLQRPIPPSTRPEVKP
jgi:S1-C subfamily serine protease